ncbi:hypothetical protein ZIOFF_002888 [Zingiber officinale]|uniref:RanBP2-type domain-containing protein n=1 Tax=Zingiber officinale TaxID=94328 RepID=A0A8J5HWY6_ZINOF|nr:hypothetical protein ZIOFF_002888 [Zingiber officinale]
MSGGMTRKPGDWVCRSCQYVNFCRRDSCQRCGELKVGVQLERADYSSISGSWDVKPGDWYCAACGVHNYASRPSCFKCSASKDDSASVIANSWGFRCNSPGGNTNWSSSWKSGDWICSRLGCNEHNYASRTECFRCNAPRSDCDFSAITVYLKCKDLDEIRGAGVGDAEIDTDQNCFDLNHWGIDEVAEMQNLTHLKIPGLQFQQISKLQNMRSAVICHLGVFAAIIGGVAEFKSVAGMLQTDRILAHCCFDDFHTPEFKLEISASSESAEMELLNCLPKIKVKAVMKTSSEIYETVFYALEGSDEDKGDHLAQRNSGNEGMYQVDIYGEVNFQNVATDVALTCLVLHLYNMTISPELSDINTSFDIRSEKKSDSAGLCNKMKLSMKNSPVCRNQPSPVISNICRNVESEFVFERCFANNMSKVRNLVTETEAAEQKLYSQPKVMVDIVQNSFKQIELHQMSLEI